MDGLQLVVSLTIWCDIFLQIIEALRNRTHDCDIFFSEQ